MRTDDIGDNFDPVPLSEIRSRGLTDSLRDVLAKRSQVAQKRLSPKYRAIVQRAIEISNRKTKELIERERHIDHPLPTCIE